MEKHRLTWISLLLVLLPLWMSAQESLKIKDQNGNVLLEAREEGVVVRKMTTAVRTAVAGLDADDNGLLVYDSDTKSLWLWHDTGWIEIDGIDLVDDADHDPMNEWQEWITLPGIPAGFLDGTDDVDDADHDPTNELQTWNTLPEKPAGFADGTDDVNDADADPTNELQDWSNLPGIPTGFLDGTDDVIDADADPTNELQTWNSLPDKPAGFADGTDDVNDADHDPTNELQDWSNLPGIPTGFMDGTDDVNDADADPTNELQTWNSLPDKPAGFADGTDDVDDADHDPTNESNMALSLTGSVLELTDNGGTLSADLASLMDEDDWMVDSGKVYNTGVDVGVGTDSPETGLHVMGDKGAGEHMMLIENENPEGSGLKIKINGNHPLWVELTDTSGFFVPTLGVPAALSNVFDSTAAAIKAYLLDGTPIGMSAFNFNDIFAPGSLLEDMGLDEMASAGICRGAEILAEFVNGMGLESISLPDLPLDGIPSDLPDIPTNLPLFSLPNLSWNPPNPCLEILNVQYCVPLNFVVPLSSLNNDPPITTFNAGLTAVNDNNAIVNTALENGYDKLRIGITALDGLEIPMPQLSVPSSIGPLTCPDPNPFENLSFSFEGWSENFGFVDPISKDNAFITFVDKGDRKLGAVTGKGFGSFAQDYFTKEKVLEIGSHVVGLISDDGNIVENVFKLAKDVFDFIKESNKIGVSYESGFGDYAEWLERANHLEQIGYGDIVGIRGGKISLSLEDAEQIMVVSKAPIVRGNAPAPGNEMNGNDVAFIGQVPVKVMGPVTTGDYIIANPSTPGYGVALNANEISPEQFALAVGKSWETNLSPGFKFVNTIVGMHNNAWVHHVRDMKQRLDTQEAALMALTARLDLLENTNGMTSSKTKK